MNPILIATLFQPSKRQMIVVLVTLAVIIALPFMAVFSLGSATVAFLFGSDSSDTISAISVTTQGLYEGPAIAGDAYDWGNCTYWVYALRIKANNPVGAYWGNANMWAINARLAGYAVDHTPTPNAVMQTGAGSLGHVAYVTQVDPITGDWTISEMNAKGLDVVDLAIYPATAAKNYNFIHDKVPTLGINL
jgi:surface antigen